MKLFENVCSLAGRKMYELVRMAKDREEWRKVTSMKSFNAAANIMTGAADRRQVTVFKAKSRATLARPISSG